jgi:hypothetical protein
MKNTFIVSVFYFLVLAGCASAPTFTIKTDPSGADIFVDGKSVGKTPATIKVKFKENAQMVTEKKILAVKLPGYKEKKEVISPEGAPIKTLEFALVPELNEKEVAPVINKEMVKIPVHENNPVAALVTSQTATQGQEINPMAAGFGTETVTMGQENHPTSEAVAQPPVDAVQVATPDAETVNTQ